jgi:hypothetical protein
LGKPEKKSYHQHPHRLQDPPKPEAQAYEPQPHGDQEHHAFGTQRGDEEKASGKCPKCSNGAPCVNRADGASYPERPVKGHLGVTGKWFLKQGQAE